MDPLPPASGDSEIGQVASSGDGVTRKTTVPSRALGSGPREDAS